MLKFFVTFLEKGNTKNFTGGKVLVYIVRSTPTDLCEYRAFNQSMHKLKNTTKPIV